MSRCIFSTLALLVASASAAPQTDAVERYDHALGQLVGATKGIAAARDVCSNGYPELEPRLTAALAEWRRRNGQTIAEIEVRWRNLRREIAGGDSTREAEVMRQLDAQTRNAEMAARAQVTRLPAEQVRALCTGLPQALASPGRDLEVLMQSQLKSVRELRPSP